MPPRKRGQRAGEPCRDARPGPSPQGAGLLDVLDAVLAHGRLDAKDIDTRDLRRLCGRARATVDGAITRLRLNCPNGDLAVLRRLVSKLTA